MVLHWYCGSCCSAYLSSCQETASNAKYWTIRVLFIAMATSWLEESARAEDFPMILWISSNSCPMNLLLVRSQQVEVIIVKRLIQGHNNVTRVRVEPSLCDQGRRKNNAFTLSATLPSFDCEAANHHTEKQSSRTGYTDWMRPSLNNWLKTVQTSDMIATKTAQNASQSVKTSRK